MIDDDVERVGHAVVAWTVAGAGIWILLASLIGWLS